MQSLTSLQFFKALGKHLAVVGAIGLCATMSVAASPADAVARVGADVRAVDPALGELPFGGDVAAIGKWIGRRIDRVWGPRIVKAVDDNERAQLRAARDKELADVTGNEVVCVGRRTGWGSSIIAGEFGAGTNESIYLWRDGEVVHFFFMHDGKLWKYAKKLEGGVGFPDRLTELQSKLGAAGAVEKESDGDGGQRPVLARWKNASFDIKAWSRRTLYGSDLFIIEDRAEAAKLAGLRAAAKAKQGDEGSSTKEIDSFLLGPDKMNE